MNSGKVMRYSRVVHGWLSAAAFIVLCLFSFTGLLLNHPEWLSNEPLEPITQHLTLDQAVIDELEWAQDPGRELAEAVLSETSLRGEYTGGNLVGPEIFARLQGVKGLTDLRLNLDNGVVEIIIEPAPSLSILNELHRGERAGSAWRLLIDIVSILLIVLSITGYLIFITLRFRRRNALIITATSGIGLYLIYHFLVF